MHIPDGFIDLKTAITTGVVSAGGLGACIYRVKKIFKSKTIAIMGVLAALIFALQMINFSIPGGTSGHLLGGALSSIVVGPCGGSIILSVVLIVQALILNDGGLTALGANIFNIAIIGTFSSYLVYYLIRKISKSKSRTNFYIAVAAASWFSVVLASFFAALEIGISGIYEMGITIKAMVIVHMIIGIGEAVITTAIIAFVDRIRPELILTSEITGERSL